MRAYVCKDHVRRASGDETFEFLSRLARAPY
jgi:hypothetical protein